MKNFILVDILNRLDNTGYEKKSLVFPKSLRLWEKAPKISSFKIVHPEVKVISVIESTDHIGDKGTFEISDYLKLV